MPFVFNFDWSVGDIRTVEIYPNGWVNPITIEYIVAQAHKYDTTLSVVWRVKGTTHCFTISEQKLNVLSRGDYKKHFTEVLENFREDYLSWFTDDYYKDVEWKYEYKEQFGRFIKGKDNES